MFEKIAKFYTSTAFATVIAAAPLFTLHADQPPKEVLSQMHQLYQNAEIAIQQDNLIQARDYYILLLQLVEEHSLEPAAKMELYGNLVNIYDKLGDDLKEQQLLTKLFEMKPVEEQLLRLAVLQARLLDRQGKKKECYLVLKALERTIPLSNWDSNSRLYASAMIDELNQGYRKKLVQAERFFDAGLYSESSCLLAEVNEGIQRGYYPEASHPSAETSAIAPQVRYRLAQAYYLAEHYPELISLLTKPIDFSPELILNSSEKFKEIEHNEVYLLGLAYRQSGQYEAAINTFRAYLRMGEAPLLEHYDKVQWELGVSHFMLGKYSHARPYFDSLCNKHAKRPFPALAKLYLVRITIAENDYKEAESKLTQIEGELEEGDPLHKEIAYLRGEIAFQLRDYGKAAECLEKALPAKPQTRVEWYPEAMYHLGWSYLKLADDPLKGRTAQERFFASGEACFEKLSKQLKHQDLFKERVYLALGQAYLRRGFRLKDPAAYAEAEKLLAMEGVFKSQEAIAHSLLLRAEAAPHYELRDGFYRELTSDTFTATSLYGQAWHLRGVNDFEEAHRLQKEGKDAAAEKVFDQSVTSFIRAFDLLKESDKGRAALALRYQAEAYDFQNTEEARLKAFSLLQTLCQQHHDLLLALAEPGEIFYLRGMVASKLANPASSTSQSPENWKKFSDIAEQSFLQVIANFSQGKYCEKSLHYLGTLYYQQDKFPQSQQMFLKLASDYPKSKEAGNALYWASQCADALQSPEEVVQQYKRQVFELYPDSPHAAEAYFTYYSYNDYLQANQQAMDHLLKMKEKFPTSPYLINAYYLIGLDYKRDRKTDEGYLVRKKELTAAIESFEESVKFFDQSQQQSWIPNAALPYFVTIRYQSQLERALSFLSIVDESTGAKKQMYLEYAEAAFQALVQELGSSENFLVKALRSTSGYTDLYEESQYGLAQVYLKQKNDTAAEQVLTNMLEYYTKANIKRGHFLSRSWYELGKLAMQRGDHALALRFLEQSEEASVGHLISAEQQLDLWIEQSYCYRSMNELDQSMTMLSKVINDNAVSSLRLKAMYLRAEIYEIQGRNELAAKQLEATAKKGGEWAAKAKEKLEQEYDIRG